MLLTYGYWCMDGRASYLST